MGDACSTLAHGCCCMLDTILAPLRWINVACKAYFYLVLLCIVIIVLVLAAVFDCLFLHRLFQSCQTPTLSDYIHP